VLALNVLEHERRLPGRRDACIEQMRDRRVCQTRDDAALAPEAFGGAGADLHVAQELDRDLAFEAAVAADRPPDAAHAAFADGRIEGVSTERLTGPGRLIDDGNGLFEESAFAEKLVLV